MKNAIQMHESDFKILGNCFIGVNDELLLLKKSLESFGNTSVESLDKRYMSNSHCYEYKQISEKVNNDCAKRITLHTNNFQELFAKMKNLRGLVMDQRKEAIFLKEQLSQQSRHKDQFHNQQKPSISETASSTNHSVYLNAVHCNFDFGANQPVKEENITKKPFKPGKLPTFDPKALVYTFKTLFEHSTKRSTDDEKLGFLMNLINTTSCNLIMPEIMGDNCYTYENASKELCKLYGSEKRIPILLRHGKTSAGCI